jgi:hypothetical protein
MIKTGRNMSELRKIVCKNMIFVVHLLVLFCEENTQSKIFYKNTTESVTILTFKCVKKQGHIFKTNVVLIINDTGTPVCVTFDTPTASLQPSTAQRERHSNLSCMRVLVQFIAVNNRFSTEIFKDDVGNGFISPAQPLMGYYTASSGKFVPTFRDNPSIPTSGVKNCFGFLTPEDGTDSLCRNFGDYHYSLRNNLKKCSSHLLRWGSLRSRIAYLCSISCYLQVYRPIKYTYFSHRVHHHKAL